MKSLWHHTTPHEHGYREARVDQLHLSSGEHIVDVREPGEFIGELGHIPQAILCPLSDLESCCEAWNREEPLIIVCRSGKRSAMACKRLVALGFSQVINLQGGMREYAKTQLPISR